LEDFGGIERGDVGGMPGRYEVMVGNSSADRDLKKIIVDIE
jgi:hypothetical protein